MSRALRLQLADLDDPGAPLVMARQGERIEF